MALSQSVVANNGKIKMYVKDSSTGSIITTTTEQPYSETIQTYELFFTAGSNNVLYIQEVSGELGWLTIESVEMSSVAPVVVAPTGYKYLGFYGEAGGSDYNTLDELYLTMSDSSTLDHTNDNTEVASITLLKATWGGENSTGTIFNGTNSYSNPYLTFHKPNPPGSFANAIYLYFEVNTNKDPINGTFYTRMAGGQSFALGKLYGTNTDPSTLANDLERMDISNWTYICDLTRVLL